MCWPVDRPATHAAAGAAVRGVRGIGGLFHRLRSGSTRGFDFLFWGALLLFVLRVVAGACVGRWTGQPRMPPQERLHEGLGGLGDCFTRSGAAARGVLVWRLRGNGGRVGGRDSGVARTPVADAVAVCFEGCYGSMCWPVDRPATHAAAGAAARGVRGIGGLFHMLGSGQTRMPPQDRRHEEIFVLRRFFHTVEAEIAGGG